MTSRFADTVTDQYKRPIPGALVYVYNWDGLNDVAGALESLTNDAGASLNNPLTTDAFGNFSFKSADGQKLLEIHFGGKLQEREIIGVGAPPKGDPGGTPQAIGLFTTAATHLGGAGFNIPTGIDIVATSGWGALDVGAGLLARNAAVNSAYVTAHPRSSFMPLGTAPGFRLSLEQDITPEILGAAGDGVADDTAALNAFLAIVAAGQKGRLSSGKTYKFTAALTPVVGNNICIEGDGEGATLLYGGASTTPDLLTFGDGTTLYFGLDLSGFTVGSTVALTGGAAVRIKKTQYVELDIVLNGPIGNQGNLYQGVYATASNYINFHTSRIYARNRCAKFSTCIEIHMGDVWVACVGTSGTAAVHLAGGNSSFFGERVRQLSAQYGLLIDNADSATANIQIFLGDECTFDSNLTAGVYLNDTGTSSISKFIHADCWCGSSSAGSGLHVAAWNNGLLYSGIGTFINNSADGINLVDTTVTVRLGGSVKITDNGTFGIDAGGAIAIECLANPHSNASGSFGTNVTVANTVPGSLKSNSATGGIGYATGAGGAVTQATNKSTAVTLNKVCGQITLNNASLAAGASVSFTLTNSVIAATDEIDVWVVSGATADSYTLGISAVAAGSCRVQLRNFTAGALAEALVIGFSVKKAVAA